MAEIERVKTGIEGLDKALNGGIPKKSLVLVSGGAGTGKSTLALQYLYNGAKQFGEKGLYISTEQSEAELKKQANAYGWDLDDLIRKNLLKIEYLDVIKTNEPLQKIYDAYSNFEPHRMVIDSLTTLTDSMLMDEMLGGSGFSLVKIAETISPTPKTEKILSKKILYNLISKLKLFQATVLMTSELPEETHHLSADETSEFIADGVIVLHYLGVAGSSTRMLQIRKLRYTDHTKSYIPYKLEVNKGIEVDIESSMDVLMK